AVRRLPWRYGRREHVPEDAADPCRRAAAAAREGEVTLRGGDRRPHPIGRGCDARRAVSRRWCAVDRTPRPERALPRRARHFTHARGGGRWLARTARRGSVEQRNARGRGAAP